MGSNSVEESDKMKAVEEEAIRAEIMQEKKRDHTMLIETWESVE